MFYYKDDELSIRNIREEDVPVLFSWWISQEINQYDPRPLPQSTEDLLRECTSFCNTFKDDVSFENKLNKEYIYFLIESKNGNPIGYINMFSFNSDFTDAELGIIIGDKTFRNKQIGFKSLKVVLQHVFTDLGFERIHIETGYNNIPALGLFKKIGFNYCDEYIDDGYKFIVMDIKKKNIMCI